MSTLYRSISLFVGVATLVLAGCGNASTGSGTASAKPAATTDEAPTVVSTRDDRLATRAISTSRPAEVPGDGARDNALAAFLNSVAHEVVHYQQWIETGQITERGVVARAGNMVDRYALTTDHP